MASGGIVGLSNGGGFGGQGFSQYGFSPILASEEASGGLGWMDMPGEYLRKRGEDGWSIGDIAGTGMDAATLALLATGGGRLGYGMLRGAATWAPRYGAWLSNLSKTSPRLAKILSLGGRHVEGQGFGRVAPVTRRQRILEQARVPRRPPSVYEKGEDIGKLLPLEELRKKGIGGWRDIVRTFKGKSTLKPGFNPTNPWWTGIKGLAGLGGAGGLGARAVMGGFGDFEEGEVNIDDPALQSMYNALMNAATEEPDPLPTPNFNLGSAAMNDMETAQMDLLKDLGTSLGTETPEEKMLAQLMTDSSYWKGKQTSKLLGDVSMALVSGNIPAGLTAASQNQQLIGDAQREAQMEVAGMAAQRARSAEQIIPLVLDIYRDKINNQREMNRLGISLQHAEDLARMQLDSAGLKTPQAFEATLMFAREMVNQDEWADEDMSGLMNMFGSALQAEMMRKGWLDPAMFGPAETIPWDQLTPEQKRAFARQQGTAPGQSGGTFPHDLRR